MGKPEKITDKEPGKNESWWCNACRQTGMIHCSDPINCGGMQILADTEINELIKAERDSRKGKG